jgi:2-polyprenyl-3-methyl-5-hydroxy-6-metoxy-1,4-benzoquinol methylase
VSTDEFAYPGGELELFARARRWKSYLESQVRPFLGPDVLEVGAGLGATTEALCRRSHKSWVCLEPDARLAAAIVASRANGRLPSCCHVVVGTIRSASLGTFDSVIYIDVLEHIEQDGAELQIASRHIASGGHLVVLSPAHAWLYSEFDRSIGHHRRYTAGALRALAPPGFRLVRLRYLDSLGALTSAANRLLLRQQVPTSTQITVWDRLMVPVSRVADPLTGYAVGRTRLAVWQKA